MSDKPEVPIPSGMVDWTNERDALRAELEMVEHSRDKLATQVQSLRAALSAACDEIESRGDADDDTTTTWRALLLLAALDCND